MAAPCWSICVDFYSCIVFVLFCCHNIPYWAQSDLPFLIHRNSLVCALRIISISWNDGWTYIPLSLWYAGRSSSHLFQNLFRLSFECQLPSPLHHPIIFFACLSLIIGFFNVCVYKLSPEMERGQVRVALHLLDIVLTQDNLIIERWFAVLVSVYFIVHVAIVM